MKWVLTPQQYPPTYSHSGMKCPKSSTFLPFKFTLTTDILSIIPNSWKTIGIQNSHTNHTTRTHNKNVSTQEFNFEILKTESQIHLQHKPQQNPQTFLLTCNFKTYLTSPEPTTSPSTLLTKGNEVPFELHLINFNKIPWQHSKPTSHFPNNSSTWKKKP